MPVHVLIQDGQILSGHEETAVVPWWSFTKTVLAAAALALVRDGVLALDARLAGRSFTLRQLLQHRAGLKDYGGIPAYHAAVAKGEVPWPPDELLERVGAGELLYPPGEGWSYSNIGYLHVRSLIEETSGQSLGDALESLIFRPLQIENVTMAETIGAVRHARGMADGYDPRWVYHGLLIGPVSQAALLLHRLMTEDLLPDALRDEMTNAIPLGGALAGRPWLAPGYGLGLMAGEATGRLRIAGHTGGGPDSVIAVYHAIDVQPPRTAAVFSPGGGEGEVESEALRLLTGSPGPD